MFESNDWIFEDAFNENDVEEETRKKSHFPCQNEKKITSLKRRRIDSSEVVPSLQDNIFIQQSGLNTVADVKDIDSSFKSQTDVSRGELLLEIFQKDSSQEVFDFAEELGNGSSEIQRKMKCFQSKMDVTSKIFQYEESRKKNHESMNEEKLVKEIKLIRIFPGPAGLIPDMKNVNISTASYLSNVEEEKNKMPTKHVEIKSQDEKNLIGEKAWKHLLNDLPKNFLKDYKISTVKNKANAYHCDNTKVRFIAGILDYIDHSHNDPFVILKDSTGSIEGTIHRDIPLTYPGILEPNIVIFLCDVGLLKTTTYVVTNKYHILASLVNLLAIYSDKGRIVSTPLMENILSHSSNIELNRNNNCMLVAKRVCMSRLQKIDESHNISWQASSSIDSSSLRIKAREPELSNDTIHPTSDKYESCDEPFRNDKNYKVTDKTHDLNCSTDIFFTTDCDFTTLELEEQNHLDPSLCKRTNISQIQEQHVPQTLQKCITDVKTCGIRYPRENCFSSCDDMTYRDNKKSTLPEIKRNIKNSKALTSCFTNDNECNKYDSDDEILSLLDIDNVVDEPKKD